MKSRLNLYSEKYAPTFSLLSLNSLTAAIVLSIVVFAVASALLAWRNSYLDIQVSQLRTQVNDLQSEIDSAQQLLANRQPDPQLVDTINNQKLELSQRQKLLQELSMREKVKNNRFSQVLADLDKADMPTVWLTTIHMSNEKIQLEGFGTRADAMPSWLANLSETSSFSGTDFQQASMVKEERGLFFSLQTDLSRSASTPQITSQRGEQ